MKKLFLGISLMISGSIISAGALISVGLIIGGIASGTGYPSSSEASESSMYIVFLGLVIFLVGFIIAIVNAYTKDKKEAKDGNIIKRN